MLQASQSKQTTSLLTREALAQRNEELSWTNGALAAAALPIRRRASLEDLLPSGHSGTTRLPPLFNPKPPPSFSDGGSSLEGRASYASSTSTATSSTSTESARLFELREVDSIYDDFEKACNGGPTVVIAGKAKTWREVLALQFPRLPKERLDALASYGEVRASQRKAAAERRARARKLVWTAEERVDLHHLFNRVDADGSGLIDVAEFVAAFESGGKLDREDLELMWRDRVGEDDDAELDFETFIRMLEDCGTGCEALFDQVRAVLNGIAEAKAKVGGGCATTPSLPALRGGGNPATSCRESLLVMDDGKAQLWRLYPGGKTLVRTTLPQGYLERRPSLADRPAVLAF